MQLREAVQIALSLPPRIALIISVVRPGLCHSEGECWPYEDIATPIGTKHRIDFGRILRMHKGGGQDDECSDAYKKKSHINVGLYTPPATPLESIYLSSLAKLNEPYLAPKSRSSHFSSVR